MQKTPSEWLVTASLQCQPTADRKENNSDPTRSLASVIEEKRRPELLVPMRSLAVQTGDLPRAMRSLGSLRIPYFGVSYAYALGRATFHESLKVQRSAFVAEVDVAFLHAFGSSDSGVLA